MRSFNLLVGILCGKTAHAKPINNTYIYIYILIFMK